MNKKLHFLMLLFFLCATLTAQNQDVNLLIKKEASEKALSFLNLIPVGSEKAYGFNNRNDFSRIRIEEPYQTYYISYKDNKLWFIPGNEWRVPISVDGKYSALLTVQMNNGNPETVDFGGSLLAEKIQEFRKSYRSSTNEDIIIRNTFLKQDYFAPTFSLLQVQNAGRSHEFEVNSNSPHFIYLINAQLPKQTSMTAFYNETMDFINNTK